MHLVRHGEVENPRGLNYGCLPGFQLSVRGREQAERTGAHLRRRTGGALSVVSSPLERALETAEIVSASISETPPEVHIDDRLLEAGSWREGLPRAFEARAYLRRALDAGARTKSEPPRTVAMRMRSAILDVLQPLEDEAGVVVVSHQFPIWMARIAFERKMGSPEEPLLPRLMPWLYVRSRCSHASVTTLVFRQSSLASIEYWEPG